MAFHDPFPQVSLAQATLQRGQVLMSDDAQMTVKDLPKLMFNLMRVFVFEPVTLQTFNSTCWPRLNTKLKENIQRDFWNYTISFEIVETLQNQTGKTLLLPVLSRFVRLDDLRAFIEENNMIYAAANHYGVRMVATHFVSDCFLYLVQEDEVYTSPERNVKGLPLSPEQKQQSLPTGNVVLKPLSYFSCGSTNLAATRHDQVFPVEQHIPDKLKENVPREMLRTNRNCSLFWLPTMQAINASDLPGKMNQAYNFHEDTDLLFVDEELDNELEEEEEEDN